MPTWTDKAPPRQQDRDHQPLSRSGEDPQDFETQVSDDGKNDNPSLDADLNPIEDDPINTHGSER